MVQMSSNKNFFGDGIITILGYDEFSLQQITIEAEVVQGEDEEEETRVKFLIIFILLTCGCFLFL